MKITVATVGHGLRYDTLNVR